MMDSAIRPVTLDDVVGLERYEAVREGLRRRVIELKRLRRVSVGPEITFVFENHATVHFQIHEMLRAERITDLDAVRRVTQGSVGQRLLAGLMRQRLVGLGFMDNGFKQMSANHPLLEPAHFRGLRMRVQASRVIAAQMRALGAKPVTLGFSETRRALAAGVVDGTENPVSNFWTQRMHEVQTDFSLTQHGYLGYAVVANQRFWSSLTSADRKLVSASLAEALGFGNQIANLQNDKALTALRAVGTTRIHVLDGDQLARMRQAVCSVHADLARRIGRTWLDDVQALLASPKG